MPLFKITTTAIGYLYIDPATAADAEGWEAVIEDEKVNTDSLADLLDDDAVHPLENTDAELDSLSTTAVELTPEEEKAYRDSQ